MTRTHDLTKPRLSATPKDPSRLDGRGAMGTFLAAAALVVTGTLAWACVLPDRSVSGLELSWQLGEGNTSEGDTGEGEEAPVIRTCPGGLVTDLIVEIEDLDDASRNGTFSFSCDEGFRSAEQLFVTIGEIFTELRPGDYRVQTHAIDDPSHRDAAGDRVEVAATDDEFAIPSGGATLAHYDIDPEPVDAQLEFVGTEDCRTIALSIEYADPTASLLDYDANTDSPVYRTGIVSDLGLALDGTPQDCANAGGLHNLPQIDRGSYRLQIVLDDTRPCQAELFHDGRETGFSLDLAGLGC